MDDKEEGIIEKLILDGGLETVGVDQETWELYTLPELKKLVKEIFKKNINE